MPDKQLIVRAHRLLAEAHETFALAYESDESSGNGRAPIPDGPEAVGSPSTAPASIPPSIDELPFDDALIPDEFRESQPSLADASVDFAPQGAEAVCPKHRTPYKDGRYGPFCTLLSDDPAWRNSKGYCSITPKNVAQYLRVKAAA